MSEIDRIDIDRIHNKIDALTNSVQTTRETVIRIDTKIQNYKQPCSALVEHITAHKESRRLFQTPLISAAIDILKMVGVAIITYLFLSKE